MVIRRVGDGEGWRREKKRLGDGGVDVLFKVKGVVLGSVC